MFGFLESQEKKVANVVADIFTPVLFSLKNKGISIDTIIRDDFLIGYMFGAVNMAARLSGLSEEKTGFTSVIFLQKVFPSENDTIAIHLSEECVMKLKEIPAPDEYKKYYDGYKEGVLEFQKMSGGMGNMESIRNYVSQM